jgi:hypothetical protein
MEAEDVLRIVLFFLIAIFALRSGSFIKTRNAIQHNNQEENEETESQQLLQRSQDTGNRINQEPMLYENKTAGKEN